MKPDVSLRQLESFVVVAEELNFGRAAQRLNISQPPLTRQIQALEAEFGTLLFHRTKHQVRLTDAGSVLLPEARRVLGQMTMVVQAVGVAGRGEGGHLSIGFEGAMMADVIPRAIGAYQEKYPAVTVLLHDLSSSAQVEALHHERIALGFIAGTVKDRAIEVETLLREPVVLALPKHHALAHHSVVPLKALAGETLLLCPRSHNPSMYDRLLGMCHRAGFEPQIVHQPAEMQLVLGFIASGLGVAIVPAAVQKLERLDVVYRALKPAPPQTELSLITKKDSASLLVSRFRQVVQQVAAEK